MPRDTYGLPLSAEHYGCGGQDGGFEVDGLSRGCLSDASEMQCKESAKMAFFWMILRAGPVVFTCVGVSWLKMMKAC